MAGKTTLRIEVDEAQAALFKEGLATLEIALTCLEDATTSDRADRNAWAAFNALEDAWARRVAGSAASFRGSPSRPGDQRY